MPSNKHRLDRLISKTLGIPKSQIRLMLAQHRIEVDGRVANSIHQPVDQFSEIRCDGKLLQQNKPIYLMMHKPAGILSATKDDQHKTVIDVLNETLDSHIHESIKNGISDKTPLFLDKIQKLHIVGRLDLHSSGLLLLTNDSIWSSKLMKPENKVTKRYLVTVKNPISSECIQAFREGIFFSYENMTTKPASLIKITETQAEVILTEGKYHQIKRMFGLFRNQVLELHRTQIGEIYLDTELKPGEFRLLTSEEIRRAN